MGKRHSPHSSNLSKELLYQGVKSLVESNDHWIHLPQHKLFTLFSLSFQYLLFHSTKNPGTYLIRLEDQALSSKLASKAKDPSTLSFMQKLIVSRKISYGQSLFILDYFSIKTWHPHLMKTHQKKQMCLVIKNPTAEPPAPFFAENDEEDKREFLLEQENLQEKKYLSQLTETFYRGVYIHQGKSPVTFVPLTFPFIKEEDFMPEAGLKVSSDLWFEE